MERDIFKTIKAFAFDVDGVLEVVDRQSSAALCVLSVFMPPCRLPGSAVPQG